MKKSTYVAIWRNAGHDNVETIEGNHVAAEIAETLQTDVVVIRTDITVREQRVIKTGTSYLVIGFDEDGAAMTLNNEREGAAFDPIVRISRHA